MKRFIIVLAVLVFVLGGCASENIEQDVIGSFKFQVRCDTILKNKDKLNKDKIEFVPENGYIIEEETLDLREGDTPYDILLKLAKERNIKVETAGNTGTPGRYVKAINNLNPGDCGEMSGWVYTVNKEYANEAANEYIIKDGDVVEWVYTCDMGNDI